ncbi:hypothetical protein NECID01_0145 [Nematocida sp. AWRm77]|nr:hypothetical protein NECID01_0145 [Nematocida sp. AWRm77]
MSCKYVSLNKALLNTEEIKIVVLGTVVIEEEQIYLEGEDLTRIRLDLPISMDTACFSDNEDKVILVMGVLKSGSIEMEHYAAFQTPPDTGLFTQMERKMHAYPALFNTESGHNV